MLPWVVGAVAVMFGAASLLVMTLGAMTSWPLATDAHSRNRAANLMMLPAPSSFGFFGQALHWPLTISSSLQWHQVFQDGDSDEGTIFVILVAA
jgi:hypothetical protein